jgi:flavin-dependent dehydrogenase
MIDSKVIIVGGGPAGSTCAWKLRQSGIECLILDKQEFPRTKLCAGWITPQVISDLKINVNDYPLSLRRLNQFDIHFSSNNFKIKVNHQYAIRRYEFDDWLLKRSGAEVYAHTVKNIKKDGYYYVIDNQYRCTYLIGAGGTHCPVYRTFFKQLNPRTKDSLIVTLEDEFLYDYRDSNCHLWFFENKLPGYSWYLPKSNGYVNIGIGGFSEKLKVNNDNIKNQWNCFIETLERLSLVKNYHPNARGYVYYLRGGLDVVNIDRVFLTGDAAGLGTKDIGEGIGPAVQSAILSAEAIITGKPFLLSLVKKYSFPRYRILAKVLGGYLISLLTRIKKIFL